MRKDIIELKNHEKKDYKCKNLRSFVSKCTFQKEKKLVKVFKISGNHESCVFEEVMGELKTIKNFFGYVASKIGLVTEWDELLPPLEYV